MIKVDNTDNTLFPYDLYLELMEGKKRLSSPGHEIIIL